MTYQQFKDYYNKHSKCINDSYEIERNVYQLQKRYEAYQKALEKKKQRHQKYYEKSLEYQEIEKDEKWLQIREQVYKRDNYKCRFYQCLTDLEKEEFNNKIGNYYLKVITPAHLFPKSIYPEIYYNPDYIFTINIISHGLIDSGKHPILGVMIDKDETEYWWKRIIGDKVYDKLKKGLEKDE